MFVVLASAAFYHVGSAPVLVELGGQVGGTMQFRLSRTASPNLEQARRLVDLLASVLHRCRGSERIRQYLTSYGPDERTETRQNSSGCP